MFRRTRRWRRRRRRGYYGRRRFGRRFRSRYGRRWRRTVRSVPVREWIPGRHRKIWVRGWEPLANLCPGDFAATEATPWKSIEPQDAAGQWHGTWGAHYFTAGNLMLRALAYWNKWSDDWASFDYIKFCGGTILIPQSAACPWMITFDEYLQTKLKGYNPPVNESLWGHPGILLNDPKTHLILPPLMYPRRKFYKIKVKAPPGWKGYQRLPEADGFICTHWLWSFFDITHCFFDPTFQQTISSCEQNPWWAGNQKLSKWMDRTKYKPCNNQGSEQESWGPFLPCKYSYASCSVFFLYKLCFKVVGNAIWRPLPRNLFSEGLVPKPVPDQLEEQPHTSVSSLKRKRPAHEADIWPGDLDSDGILTKEAFKRVIGDNQRSKRRKMDTARRLRYLASNLKLILARYNLIKRQ
nr:ORF1 [Torque teno felis virus]